MNTVGEGWLIVLLVVFIIIIAAVIYGVVKLWKWISK